MQDYQNVSNRISYRSYCEKCYYGNVIYFGLIFLEIAIMFLLARDISKTLSKFMSISFLSFVFLPGVIIHELSHMLIAVILLVTVGDMEFSPKTSPNGVKLGSVEIGKTDPIRRSIIGFAPVFVGMVLILGMIYFVVNNKLLGIGAVLLMLYFLFAVSNTMFSSTKDMGGTIEIVVALLITVALLYLAGVRLPMPWIWGSLESNAELIKKFCLFLLAPITINIVMLGAIKIIQKSKLKSQKYK